MPDNSATTGMQQDTTTGGIVVSQKLRDEHPVLIDLILKSESMNDEERRYWLDILPVMTEDQITQLHDILQKERDQLAAIDAKYSQKIDAVEKVQKPLEEITKKRRERATQRSSSEQVAKEKETEAAEELLKKMEEL